VRVNDDVVVFLRLIGEVQLARILDVYLDDLIVRNEITWEEDFVVYDETTGYDYHHNVPDDLFVLQDFDDFDDATHYDFDDFDDATQSDDDLEIDALEITEINQHLFNDDLFDGNQNLILPLLPVDGNQNVILPMNLLPAFAAIDVNDSDGSIEY
jgi:hypothetical protein